MRYILATAANFFILGLTQADIYLYSPRGSNNRLYETTAPVQNPYRLFWSNNDLRGGVNIGVTNQNKAGKNPNSSDQYRETYFASGNEGGSTFKHVQFAIDKGCGEDENGGIVHECKVVLQASCQDGVGVGESGGGELGKGFLWGSYFLAFFKIFQKIRDHQKITNFSS